MKTRFNLGVDGGNKSLRSGRAKHDHSDRVSLKPYLTLSSQPAI